MWAALCGDASRRDYRRFIFAAFAINILRRLLLSSAMLSPFGGINLRDPSGLIRGISG
jgi:hypothetical protein